MWLWIKDVIERNWKKFYGLNCVVGLSQNKKLSLGDAIHLELKFERFCNPFGFQLKIQVKFGSRFLIVATKSIKLCPDCIEKVDIYRKRSNLNQKWLKKIVLKINGLFWYQLTFFHLLIDYFNLVINLYWSFNQKEIESNPF